LQQKKQHENNIKIIGGNCNGKNNMTPIQKLLEKIGTEKTT
jgi:hypothetical protein